MIRTASRLITAVIWGFVASVSAGYLIGSWTIADMTRPLPTAPPRMARADPPVADWREASLRRIGVWEHEREAPR